MAYRKSLAAKREHQRNIKDKRGNWRNVADEVTGSDFNVRVMAEPEGFFRGARVTRRAQHGKAIRGGSR
jgi:hypothetical protein